MFRTVPLSIIRSFSLYTQQWYMSLQCIQWKTPDEGQRNCPKHVEFYSKNKFEKLVHLVGFIIRIFCFIQPLVELDLAQCMKIAVFWSIMQTKMRPGDISWPLTLHLMLRLIVPGTIPPLRHMHLDFFTSPVERSEHRTFGEGWCRPVHG